MATEQLTDVDILPFSGSTNFGDRTDYGTELDKDIDRYRDYLSGASAEAEAVKTAKGADQSALIKEQNVDYRTDTDKYRTEIDRINAEYSTSVDDRRTQADELIESQRSAAGLEANIAAAKANQGGRMSVSQLTSINKDITNQFSVSMNNALKDNINFNIELDGKLADMGFSTVDKQRVLDEFEKSLDDAEAAPLLDAIAEKYDVRSDFLTALSDVITGINEAQIDDSASAIQRAERLARDEAAWDNMSTSEREDNIRDRFGPTWNVLTPSQKEQIIQDTVSGVQSYRETLDMIENYKDQAEVNKAERQQTLASSKDEEANRAILSTSSTRDKDIGSTTIGTKPNTYVDPGPEPGVPYVAPVAKATTPPVVTPAPVIKPPVNEITNDYYTIGGLTFINKAAYDLVKGAEAGLNKLKISDPTKYAETLKLIQEKYLIT